MFDIGWPELLMVAVVLILVVGPKDLPPMLRAFGRTVKKYRGMANDFKRQFDDALEESELDELRQTVAEAKSYNPLNQVKDAVNDVGAEISDAVEDAKPVKPWVPKPEEISDAARSVGEKEAKAAAAKAPVRKTTARKAAGQKTAAKKAAAPKKTTAPVRKSTGRKPAAKTSTNKSPVAPKTNVRKPRTTTAKTKGASVDTGKAKVK
ncbi:Sec-independent protein translocase protein TatB [Lentilitoribacter sp. EG35]|jgi:sec-independent protein translocase protein TatB|uniref:Sec-independent protein translocase protein TatB n=1 Tax=Lentilitoribacter sp. EG35 TaxID=3234192 RepID=UPI00345F6338